MRGIAAGRSFVLATTVAGIACFSSFASIAHAAVDTSPAQASCAGKAVGDRCPVEGGRTGTCRASTCTRFEHWKSPATTASYDCVLCVGEGDASANATGRTAKDAPSRGCAVGGASGSGEAIVLVLSVLARRARGGVR